ncbi:MAG: hypothetical protein FWB86_03380 [Treponema sp.]|nr:hypothetical protein [Treponema sp.]MCL2251199.1 hypothetical protein [Treponema sp.]
MNIRINGVTLDVSLEKEKYVSEILTEIEKWLSDSGHVLSGLTVDGKEMNASEIDNVFKKEISTIENLDIHTESISFLTSSCLSVLLEDIKKFESISFEEKSNFFNNWKETSCAKFINEETPDLFSLCENTFLRGEISCQLLVSVTEERIREINEPDTEFSKLESVINEICGKLTDLPLDIQTGKEAQAAQTIQLFTAITEKIMRIYYQLDTQGYFNKEQYEAEKEKIIKRITDFTGILQELYDAYQKNDSVLVGDLAEYEASVRIKEIYSIILSKIQPQTEKLR